LQRALAEEATAEDNLLDSIAVRIDDFRNAVRAVDFRVRNDATIAQNDRALRPPVLRVRGEAFANGYEVERLACVRSREKTGNSGIHARDDLPARPRLL